MRIGMILGWFVTLAGIAAIIAGCVMNPANWWYIGPGIAATVIGLFILAANSESDWVPDFFGDIVDTIITIEIFDFFADL